MNRFHRQTVLLMGFMALLTTVILFLFVYAPDPVEPLSISVPEPFQNIVNQTIRGWSDIISTFGSSGNMTYR